MIRKVISGGQYAEAMPDGRWICTTGPYDKLQTWWGNLAPPPLGLLKRHEHFFAEVNCVGQSLEPGSKLFPRVVSEVRMPGSWGHDKDIESDRPTIPQPDNPLGTIDGQDLIHDHPDIGAPPKDRPQRPGDIAGRERGSSHLVQQRLEQMMIGPVDDDHIDIAERLRGREAPEPAPDDDDPFARHDRQTRDRLRVGMGRCQRVEGKTD